MGPELQQVTLSQGDMYKGARLGACTHEGGERTAEYQVALCPSQLLLRPADPQFSSSLSSGLMAGLVRL